MQKIKKFAFLAMMAAFVLGMTGCDKIDLTPPGEVENIKVTVTDGTAIITWEDPTDDDLDKIEYKVEPASGLINSNGTVDAKIKTCTVSGIKVGTEYTITFWTYDNSISENKSSGTRKYFTWDGTNGSSATGDSGNTGTGGSGSTSTGDTTSDTTPPAKVTNLTTAASNGQVTLSWTNPTDADFAKVIVSAEPAAGDLANPKELTNKEETLTVTGLTNGTEYTFTIVSVDTTGNKSEGEVVKASPVIPPEVIDLQVESGSSGSVKLSWTNPADDKITGIEVSYVKSDWSKQDSVSLEKDKTSYTFADMEKGQTYTFTVKTKYSDSNKSEGVSKTVTTKSYCEITTKAVDEGIKVTIKMLENVYFKDNCVTENTTGLTWSYGSKDSDLFTDGIYSLVFPFTENGKEYSFKIAGWVVDKTTGVVLNNVWYDETLSTCTATTTTDAGRWYANNMDYFTDYNVDCGYNAETQKFEVYRLFKQLDGITDADAQKAKVKNIMKSVINAKPDSVAKVSAYFYTVFGDVNWDNSTKWVGDGEKELSYDESTTYEQKETVSIGDWYISSGSDYSASVKKLCEQPFNGRYGTHHNYKIYLTSEETWSTSSYHSLQKYYYVEKTGTGTKYATKAATRVLHAVYDKDLSQGQANSRYLVKDDETKDVGADTTLKDLAKSYDGYEAETLIQTDNYLAVLYKAVETTETTTTN